MVLYWEQPCMCTVTMYMYMYYMYMYARVSHIAVCWLVNVLYMCMDQMHQYCVMYETFLFSHLEIARVRVRILVIV